MCVCCVTHHHTCRALDMTPFQGRLLHLLPAKRKPGEDVDDKADKEVRHRHTHTHPPTLVCGWSSAASSHQTPGFVVGSVQESLARSSGEPNHIRA